MLHATYKNKSWMQIAFGFALPLFGAALFILLFAWNQGALAWEGSVTKVTDGDTIDVRRSGTGEEVTIRLYGIDTPETDQPHGRKASRALGNMVSGSEVRIEKVDTDPYGRTVALVFQGARPVNEVLVRRGHAWVYDRYCERPVCRGWKHLESRAKDADKGLWAQDDPTPPWEWRH